MSPLIPYNLKHFEQKFILIIGAEIKGNLVFFTFDQPVVTFAWNCFEIIFNMADLRRPSWYYLRWLTGTLKMTDLSNFRVVLKFYSLASYNSTEVANIFWKNWVSPFCQSNIILRMKNLWHTADSNNHLLKI